VLLGLIAAPFRIDADRLISSNPAVITAAGALTATVSDTGAVHRPAVTGPGCPCSGGPGVCESRTAG
jgi:hypothetical protein